MTLDIMRLRVQPLPLELAQAVEPLHAVPRFPSMLTLLLL